MEILCIGNELLIGKTLNTNAHWLAGQATSQGIIVKRITTVEDDIGEIATVVQEALHRKPRFIVTTGGLGPTFDDKTLTGIAKALNRRLQVNTTALEMIRRKYEAHFNRKLEKKDMTPARIKMATLPEKAKPLPNPVGTAPGVLLSVGQASIVVLPGVPPEMEMIFKDSVVPLLRKETGTIAFFEKSIFAHGIVESALAPLIDTVMRESPVVYVKSHVYVKSNAGSEAKRPQIELHLSTTSTNAKTAQTSLSKAAAQLSRLIEKNGGMVVPQKVKQQPN
jgi:molybdenum cofactor synthesis domain-containing protein